MKAPYTQASSEPRQRREAPPCGWNGVRRHLGLSLSAWSCEILASGSTRAMTCHEVQEEASQVAGLRSCAACGLRKLDKPEKPEEEEEKEEGPALGKASCFRDPLRF